MGGGGDPSGVSGSMGDSLDSSWESVRDSGDSMPPLEEQLSAGSTSVVPEVSPGSTPQTPLMESYPHLTPEDTEETNDLSGSTKNDKGERKEGAAGEVTGQGSFPRSTEKKAASDRGVAGLKTERVSKEGSPPLLTPEGKAATAQGAATLTGKDEAKNEPFGLTSGEWAATARLREEIRKFAPSDWIPEHLVANAARRNKQSVAEAEPCNWAPGDLAAIAQETARLTREAVAKGDLWTPEELAAMAQETAKLTKEGVAKGDSSFHWTSEDLAAIAQESARLAREAMADNIPSLETPEGKSPVSGCAPVPEREEAIEDASRQEETALDGESERLCKMQEQGGESTPAHIGTENQGGKAQREALKQALEKSKARLAKKAADLPALRKDVISYVPGAKLLLFAADRTAQDYDIPERTVLLLVGDMGAGKSTLVNNVYRAVHNTKTDLDIAATANCSTGSHSMLLQEYAITPRVLLFDTRGLSVGNTGENVQLLKAWIKEGVADSQAVFRSSDGQESREAIQDRVRPHQRSFRKRRVNFAIYVINAATIHDVRQRSYDERLAEAQRMRKIFQALHHFKDNSPVIVMTHGDQLSPEDRDAARVFIGETLGVDPGDSVYDIASFTGREQEAEEVDPIVDATILCMLQQTLKLADRSLPPMRATNYDEIMDKIGFALGFIGTVLILYFALKWLTNMI